MLKIDNTLLQEIGLGTLPEGEKNSLLKHIYETLEMRVGIRLADQMSNQQLDEFEQYFEAKDDAGAFKWLESNFPNYKDIVQEEFDKLKAEVAQSAPQILASAQAAPAPQIPVDTAQAAPFNPQAVGQAPAQPPVAPQAPQPAPAPQPYQPAPAPQPEYQAPQPQVAPAAPAQPYAAPPQPQQYAPAPSPDYPQQQPPAGPQQ